MTSDPSIQQANNSNKKEEEQFPIKLHRILEEAEVNGFSDCISWMPDGTSFKIFDKTRLENEVMPQYFESCQFKSFQRSLNMWGFVADNKKSDTTTGGGRRHHPLFVKGRPELCCAMRRVRVKKPGARSKKAMVIEADKETATPPDSPRTTKLHEESTTPTAVTSGFLAPCLQGDRYDQTIGNMTNDNCNVGLVQQLCQSQSSNALLHALLATKFQPGRDHQDRPILLNSQPSLHPIEIPTDFNGVANHESLLASTLAKLLNNTRTTSSRTMPLLQQVLPSIIGQALTTPAASISERAGLSQATVDEAALRQAAIALATAGWQPPIASNKHAEYFTDPKQHVEKLLVMNMFLQQQQQQQQQQQPSPSSLSSNSLITDAIRRNLVHNDAGGGGSSLSSTRTSSPRQNSNHGGGLELSGQVSPASLPLPNPTMTTLDLASSLLLQHFNVVAPSSTGSS